MAARRCRIKAVANLPIRRDRGGGIDEHSLQKEIKEKSNEQNKTVEGNPTTSKDETLKENNSNIVSLKVNSPKNVIFNHPSNEHTINVNNALTRPISEELSQSNISVVISPQTNGNDHEKQDFETSTSKVKAIVSETKSTEQDSVSSKLPIKFVGRKRVKPAVSISNISRKAKEIIVVTDEVLPEPNALRSNHEPSSTSSSCHLTAMEESPITDKSKYNISLSQVDVTLPLDKDIGVGMPTIIQTIPTGTAMRPNESNCPSNEFSAPGLLHTNGEAPQTLPEADLPSEGAGGSTGGLAMDPPCLPNIVPCPSNTPHRSKFARPTPRIPDKTSRRRGHSSASESDDDSKRPFINSGTTTTRSKFARLSPKVGDATSRRTGNHGSASESDDESRRPSLSKSPALTSVLPISSRIITKTMNGTAKQGSASESEDDVIIVEPDPVKEPSCMEKQQDKNSGIGSKELVGESEERDENIKSIWSKRTINHIRRKRHNAITSRIAQGKKELDTKLNGSKPARSSLTMFDLIYYNPTTNPMKKVVPSESVDHTKSINEGENRLVEERLAEEAVDDVTNSTSNVEEETALPVPQVKVGPDGQLILDEMSLVIETTGAKKSREELENSSIVVDLGIGSTSYSAYSKKTYKKGKEWSAHEMEIEQEERRKEEAKQKKLAKLEYRKLHKRKPGQSYATSFIFEKQDTGEFHNKRLRKRVCKSKIENKSKKKKRNNALEKGFCGIASDSDSENSSYNEEYESDGNKNDVSSKTCEEVVLNKKPRATKSGRISRPKVMHDHVHDFIELDGESSNDNSIVPMSPVNESIQATTGDINAETLEQISKSAPGSLLIFRAPSPTNPDHQVVHVFMLGGPLPENTPVLTDSGGDLTSKDIGNSVLELNPLANQSNTAETETCNKNSEETPFSLIFPK
uniref:Uncharacterized protein n=1 Tax=Timema tahoe TaxID=61484 RepID=A0A7R9II48_9NEOP|nr:unnamed protein product [Timema tahoe]